MLTHMSQENFEVRNDFKNKILSSQDLVYGHIVIFSLLVLPRILAFAVLVLATILLKFFSLDLKLSILTDFLLGTFVSIFVLCVNCMYIIFILLRRNIFFTTKKNTFYLIVLFFLVGVSVADMVLGGCSSYIVEFLLNINGIVSQCNGSVPPPVI